MQQQEQFIADRIKTVKASAIREIFKMIGQSDIISFAGGNPSPDTFPGKELGAIAQEIMSTNPMSMQYGITEGYAPLLKLVTENMQKIGNLHEHDGVIITAGGQQAIDFTAKSLVNEGDVVAVESPSFIGGLNAFRSYNAKLAGITLKDDGLDLDELEGLLKKQKIKLLYTIPTFQNPSGITMSLAKRKALLELAQKYDFYILEDNPYGELRFAGEDVATIKSMDTEGRVIYAGTFSKTLSPGLRLGWVVARGDILDRIIVCKQASDVHTAVINQMMAYEYMTRCDFAAHIQQIRNLYGHKCHLMMDAIDQNFPAWAHRTTPEGGIFLWCSLDKDIDTKELMAKCVEKKVAFVPGSTCMVDIEAKCSMLRLNYSTPSDEQIVTGIKIMAEVLKEYE